MAGTPAVFIDWNKDGDYSDTGETVTTRVLHRTAVSIGYGRDRARALSPPAPGVSSFALNNASRDYSPENGSSPLAGTILPARPVLIQRTLSAVTYSLHRGQIDGYEVNPEKAERSVAVTTLDALAGFGNSTVSTELYSGIRTGTAVGYVLDALGWPTASRDLDPGASVLPWWWEDNADGLEALKRLVQAEGIPALLYVDPATGYVVFRDRHHRLLETASLTSQATFRGSGTEPLFSAPVKYDHGWKEVVNSVTIAVGERGPAVEVSAVWTSQDIVTLAAGETKILRVEASEPFMSAITPESGTDYTVLSGSISIVLTRTSGKSTTMLITAGGAAASLYQLQLRAYSVAVKRTIQVTAEDAASVTKYGRRSAPSGFEAPFVNVHDAAAIADVLLAYHAERLPIVSFTVENKNDTRETQQLVRALSDRVTLSDTEIGLSDEFFLDRIEHYFEALYIRTTFHAEKAPTVPGNVFRFDVTGAGFDDGVFGASGLDDPDTVFIFDDPDQGKFDVGVFGT